MTTTKTKSEKTKKIDQINRAEQKWNDELNEYNRLKEALFTFERHVIMQSARVSKAYRHYEKLHRANR